MFRGINAINMDVKGRMAMPTRYRGALIEDCGAQLVATIDTEAPCLLLYPQPEWEQIERKIEALPSFNAQARRIQRLLIGHATDLELDSHGRILVPPLLREYAALEKRVMLVGQGRKFEIWSETLWQQQRDSWIREGLSKSDGMPDELSTLSL